MLSVDFKQSYNCVNRQELWTILKIFRIPEKLVKTIEICNSNIYCQVRYGGELFEHFELKSGLRQGDALLPIFLTSHYKI